MGLVSFRFWQLRVPVRGRGPGRSLLPAPFLHHPGGRVHDHRHRCALLRLLLPHQTQQPTDQEHDRCVTHFVALKNVLLH